MSGRNTTAVKQNLACGRSHATRTMLPIIRFERSEDAAAIDEVTRQAFALHPRSRHNEHLIVRGLREADALSISLVAESAGEIVGHIAFSPVSISDGTCGWVGLGPVSVLPSLQQQGIGTALVKHGLQLLRERGVAGCVLLGEPLFYGRFGFANSPDLLLPGVRQAFFLTLPFSPELPSGTVTYHAAFAVPG